MVSCDAIKPNEITILAIFPAVWSFGDLRMCGSVHGYVEKTGFVPCDIRVTNSLIDAYAKCGCIRSALKFFTEVSNERKNLVSWTTMISAFAMHGMGKEAINLSSWFVVETGAAKGSTFNGGTPNWVLNEYLSTKLKLRTFVKR